MRKVNADFGYNDSTKCMGDANADQLLLNLGVNYSLAWPEYMKYSTNPNSTQVYKDDLGNTKNVKNVNPPVGSSRSLIINNLQSNYSVAGVGDIYIDEQNNLNQVGWWQISALPSIFPIPSEAPAVITNLSTVPVSSTSNLAVVTPIITNPVEVAVITRLNNSQVDIAPTPLNSAELVSLPTNAIVVAPTVPPMIPALAVNAVITRLNNSQVDIAPTPTTTPTPPKSKAPLLIGGAGLLAYYLLHK